MMFTAFIISTGNEIMIGDTLDTNAHYLSRRLTEMGLKVTGHMSVGDDREMLRMAITTARSRADLVVMSGGLGPTLDDLTREVAYEVAGVEPLFNEKAFAAIEDYFKARGVMMPDNNRKQALIPENAKVLSNSCGTAPGVWFEKEGVTYLLLPGPPREMVPMFENEAVPLIQGVVRNNGEHLRSELVKTFGMGESQVEEVLADFLKNPDGMEVSLLARDGEVHVRITGRDGDRQNLDKRLAAAVNTIKNALGSNCYGMGDDTLPLVVGRVLKGVGKTVALAESCTGGLTAKLLTDVPGSSAYFWGGVVVYDNAAKVRLLRIDEELIKEKGAVSHEVAEAMACGVRQLSGCDYGIGITGIAGPDGGSEEKPVGLVYIGLAAKDYCQVKRFTFKGGREAVRVLAAKTALDWLRREAVDGREGH